MMSKIFYFLIFIMLLSAQDAHAQNYWSYGIRGGGAFTGYTDGTGSFAGVSLERSLTKKFSISTSINIARFGSGRRGNFTELNNSQNVPLFYNGGGRIASVNFIPNSTNQDGTEVLKLLNSGLKHSFGPQSMVQSSYINLTANYKLLNRKKYNFIVEGGLAVASIDGTSKVLSVTTNLTDTQNQFPAKIYYILYNASTKGFECGFALAIRNQISITDKIALSANLGVNQFILTSNIIQFELGLGVSYGFK
ncbi:MAG: hypothetical protein WAT92_10675 [Saprospiraceae bacterium]